MTKPFPFATLESDNLASFDKVNNQSSWTSAEESDGRFPSFSFDCAPPKRMKIVEPTYSEQELATAIEEARRATALEVEAKTRAAVSEELDHRQVEALEAMRDQLGASKEILDHWMSETVSMAQMLAVMVGKAVVPKALELQPVADIAFMIRQSLLHLVDQPSIELRLDAALAERSAEMLREIAEEIGFRGELKTIVDPTLHSGSAQLVWKGGVADRDLGRIQEEVGTIIEAWFAQQSAHPSLSQSVSRVSKVKDQADTETDPPEAEHHSSTERSIS